MRHFIISLFLIILMVAIQFFYFPYKPWFFTGIVILFICNHIFLIKAIINRPMIGEIEVRKLREGPRYFLLILAIMSTLSIVLSRRQDIYMALTLWIFIIANIVASQLYKKSKPMFLVVNDGKLIFNGSARLTKRNVESLTEIGLDAWTNKMIFSFNDSSALDIERGEYSDIELRSLVEYLIANSKQVVKLNRNMKLEFGLGVTALSDNKS